MAVCSWECTSKLTGCCVMCSCGGATSNPMLNTERPPSMSTRLNLFVHTHASFNTVHTHRCTRCIRSVLPSNFPIDTFDGSTLTAPLALRL